VRRSFVLTSILVALVLAACGESSGPSEKEAVHLIERHTVLTNTECVKSTGSDREFTCTAKSTDPVRIKATVSVSGKSVIITHCEAMESGPKILSQPCESIGSIY
jgi:hypothetical protein